MKNFLTLIGANVPTAAVCTAKMPQNTGGGNSQCLTLRSIGAQYFTRFLGSSCRVWKYVACMLMVLFMGVGNVWGTADVEVLKMTDSDFSKYFKAYTDVTLANTCGSSNVTVDAIKYYAPKVDKTDNSTWITVKSNGAKLIDKIELLASANNTDKNNLLVGWAGWNTVSASNGVGASDRWPDAAGSPTSTDKSNSTSIVDTIKIVFDFSESSYKEVRITKRWNGITLYGGSSSANYPSSDAQTIRVYGFRVWMRSASGGGDDPECEATANAGSDKNTTIGVGVAMAATAAETGYAGAWSIKAGSPSTDAGQLGTTSSNTMTFTPNTYGTYTLVWTVTSTEDGTCKATDEATVTVPAPTHNITYTNTKDAVNSNPATYTEGTGIASFAKLRHVVGYDFTGWSPTSIAADATGAKTVEAQWTANAVAEGTGTLTYALAFGSGSITTTSITRDNGALYDATDVSLEHTSFNNNSTSKGCSGKLTTTTDKDNNNYVKVTFKVASGYTFTPTEVRVQGIAVTTTKTIAVELKDNAATPHEKTVTGSLTAVSSPTTGGYTVTLDFDESDPVVLEGTVTAKIYAYGANDHWRMGTPFVITGTLASTTPASGYAITKSATNGTIAVTNGSDAITSADAGDKVYIAATPATGYGFTSWSVYKTGDESTVVDLDTDDDTDNKTRKFTMPAYPVTVGATFTAIDYTITHSAATNGSYTIKVGEVAAVSTSTTANYGQTVVLAATPESGYKFKAWTVLNGETPVSVSSNQFTMPAGNVTVSAEFEEVDCPTSGTVFGWAKKTGLSDSNFSAGTYTYTSAAPGNYLTSVTGGTVELSVNADNRIRIKSSELNFNGGDSYIHVTSDCAFQEGDVINVSSSDNTGNLKITLSSTAPGKDGAKEVGTITQGTPFIILVNGDNADLDLVGETEFYIWRSSGSTNVGTLTITRPLKYAVTYSSEKGEAPSGVSAASVTLAEITGVNGWKNTGWKADVTTEVGGESVDANTLIANGAVVTLSGATTFTAQWAELYTITTGSPANGTIAADKSNAVAGTTITLTNTPSGGYKLSAWDVYKTGDATTKVTVTNNKFTMPAYGVTISAEFVESVVLYDYSVMENKSFTGETVAEDAKDKDKSKTFGTVGNPQLVVTNAGWDKKDNIINSFIKFFGGTSSMSVVIPTGRKATVTIQYGSYDANGKYLQVNGTNQAKPVANMSDDDMTTETFGNYMRTVELTNQTGTLALTSNTGNIYIAYVDVTLTGYASYDITYHLNDGAWDGDAGAATYTYGTGIATLATNVTKTGYDFAGWYGNEGLEDDKITSIANNVTGDKELWAKWAPKSYTLTWDWNGGSCSATAGEDYTAGGSVAYGAAITYPEASTMSKADAAFAGWSSTPETMPAEALTITAQWAPSHAITYTETKGATNANPTTYVEGIGVASFEPLADVADFHFTGWSPASISAEATTDQTIVAQWVAAYNVTFSAGEGSGTVPATFQKWATASFELPGQGTMVAPEGKIFVGWKVNGAGENRAAGYEYTMTAAAVEFVAQWKAVTLLINYDGENYNLNTTDFQTGVTLQDEIVASGYPKNAKFGNTCSSVSSIDNLGKAIIYHTKTNATKVTISAYNNYTGGSTGNLYYSVVEEGATSASVTTKGMTKGSATTDYVVNMTGRSTLYIMCGHDIRICQVSVEENGTANKVAPEVGYSINLNKQRPLLLSGVATSFEGVEYKVASNFKPVNGQVQINALTNTYYKFTIPTGQTRQLQLTTSNTNKYVVSKTLGDDTEAKKISGNQNINLTEGTWYINPQGSNVNITNIAFAAAPAALTVTFKDGATTLGTQNVWSGEKATALSPAPTKSGHRFVEWQLSGSAYDFDDEVTTDITLDAVWQETVTVTFAPANGESNFTKQADKGAVLAAGDRPADPEYAGHVFQGWTRNASADPVAYVNLASETFSADATLTAVWEVAQTDATISALSYNGNAINVASAEDVAGVATYTVHLQWGTTIDKDLISVTKTASSATVGTIAYDSEAKKATFTVTAGDGTTTADYAIQFVIDAKRGTSIVKAFVSGGDQKAGFAATGLYGDKGYANTRANKKLDTADKFVGVKLLSGETFEAGDKLYVVTSTDADRGYIEIYEEAAGTNLIKATGVRDASEGITVAELAGHNEFYIVRKESDGDQAWNGIVEYVEVTREMNPVIKSFKFGDDAATINESAKTISIDVPYGTAVTALTPTVEAYGNNGATYTPDGATDFTSPVDYVVKDAYNEFSTTYTVTVNVAAPSENANLASLSVAGYALDFNKATTSYNVVLDYGTTDLPEITYAVEDAGLANAVKVEGGVNGATTITVTPQAGAGYEKVYTINFTVSTTPKFVIYDGSTMTNIASRAFNEATSGFSYTIEDGVPVEGENATATLSGKNYTKVIKSFRPDDNPKFSIVVPNGYVAKVYMVIASNSNNSTRSFFISKTATGTKDETYGCVTSTTQTDVESGTSAYLLPDTYYFGATDGVRLYELSVTLYPAHMRNATVGKMATVCLPNNVEADGIIGAEVYELLYWKYGTSYADCQMVDFGEVTSMEEGHAYLFIPTADKVAFVLGNNVAPAPVVVRGFTGTFVAIADAYDNVLTGKYGVVNNMIQKLGHNCYSAANRAYIDLEQTPSKEEYDAQPHMTNHAPRKRISLGHKVDGEPIATGLDAINVESEDVKKVMINGEMFIIRDGHIYSATGMMVK